MLLAIDPSSTVIGYAIFSDDGRLDESGRLVARRRDGAMDRIADLVRDLEELWQEQRPNKVVIEVTSGKSARRLRKKVQGLSVYGMAVGATWQLLRSLVGPQNVRAVEENVWTGQVPKGRRLRLLAAEERNYDPVKDPGGDAGDAICLGKWFIAQKRIVGV